MTSLYPPLVGAPILGGLGTLAWYSYQRLQREKSAAARAEAAEEVLRMLAEQPLPVGSVQLVDGDDVQRVPPLSGKIMLVLAGTFGCNLGIRLLKTLDLCGLSEAIGAVLFIELDEGLRARFLDDMPLVFHDRLVVATRASLSGGGANKTLAWIRSRRPHWVPEILARAEEVCDLHQRRSPRGSEAAHIVAIVSNGSTGYMGADAVAAIMKRFRNAFCVGLIAYSHHVRLRGRLQETIQAYSAAGCHGFLTADNLADEACPQRDHLLNDLGMVSIVVGLLSSTRHQDAITETVNVLSLVFPEKPGGLASFRTVLTTVPAYGAPANAEGHRRHFAWGDAVESAVLGVIEDLRGISSNQAVSAALGRSDSSQFEVILLPVVPAFLESVADNTLVALQTVGPFPPNFDLLFAGTKTVIDPDRPTCPIVGVSLAAISDPAVHLAEVAPAAVVVSRRNGAAKRATAVTR